MNPDTYVYCTQCKWFKLDGEDDVPHCKFSSECDIWDCEDSRPFSERPKYEKRVEFTWCTFDE